MEKSDAPRGPGNAPNHGSDTQDSGALANFPGGVAGNPPPPPERRNIHNHSYQPPWWRRLDTWKFIGEIMIVAITIKIAFIYSGQLSQMIESNHITRESLTSVQRAFVTFLQVNLETAPSSLQGKRQWIFTAIIENSGTTPAISKIQFFDGDNGLQEEPSEEQFIGNAKDRPKGEMGQKVQKIMGPILKDDIFILGNYSLSSLGSEDFKSFSGI